MSDTPLILLAAGGTGGHVFPAEALAARLKERGLRLGLVTDRRGTNYGGVLGGIETHRLRVSSLSGGIAQRLQGVVDLGLSVLEARRLFARLRPKVVVGFGGYPSLPTMIAATRSGIPTVIHEQNAVLGRANRWVVARVGAVALSFAQVRFLPEAARARARLTGNPIRESVIAARRTPYVVPIPGMKISVLVTGGSQGAAIFSKVVPAAIAGLSAGERARLAIIQQCRPEDIDAARAAYRDIGVSAELATFFSDLPERLANAQLVICRSGASTVAELTAIGRPAILVPYLHATDDHQSANAAVLAEAGAAWLVPQSAFTPADLTRRLVELLAEPAPLARMAAAARNLGRPNAADRLADLVEQMAGTNGQAREHAA